jgi:DNA-binding beta-propeller fold protein YncE
MDGSYVSQYGGGGIVEGRFDEPTGLAQDGEGNWYIADAWNLRIQKFDANFRYLSEWSIDGWGSQSVVNKPDLAVDSARGLVYASDPENYRVLVFRTDGTFHAMFGMYGNDEFSFVLPTGLDVDAEGRLYVADGDGQRIMVFPPMQ